MEIKASPMCSRNTFHLVHVIRPRHSTTTLILILPPIRQKALIPRLFLTPFVTRFLGFYQQSYTLGGSLLPYRFVVNSLLYDSYPMGRTSASTSLMPQLVQAVILPQHGASVETNPPAVLSSIHSPILGRV